jgi:hypothetical protein
MVAHHRNRVKDVKEELWGAMERPAEVVKEYPISSMLLMFGLGLGVGVLVSQTLCAALMEAVEEPTMSEKMRRQVFDALSHVLPKSTMQQLQNYTS